MIEEVEVSPPQPMEIRVKVVATALCRSDFNAWLSQATPLFLVLSLNLLYHIFFIVIETNPSKSVIFCRQPFIYFLGYSGMKHQGRVLYSSVR